MKMFSTLVLAWFLTYQPYNQQAVRLGPFATQAECSRIAAEIERSRTAAFVSSCWQG